MSKEPEYWAVDIDTIDAKYQEGTTEAPENMVWVCGACGKTSRTRYGHNAENKNVCDPGWDTSCMMHAVLCYKKEGSRSSQWFWLDKRPHSAR